MRFGPLPAQAVDYGFFDSVIVSREGLVVVETNRYSVPVHLLGQVLTARIHRTRIELFAGIERVAVHPRHPGQHARIVDPAHFEPAFQVKPRARVMVQRDWLVALSPVAASYVSELCRRRRAEMSAQITALYALAQQLGSADFLAALELAAEQQTIGAEYVRAIATRQRLDPRRTTHSAPLTSPLGGWQAEPHPPQRAVERDLAHYERYVANRAVEEGTSRPSPLDRRETEAGGPS